MISASVVRAVQAAARAFGLAPEAVAGSIEAVPPVQFGVWAENEAPLAVLMAMRTQLRRSGLDGRVEGLDYAVLPWVMRRCG